MTQIAKTEFSLMPTTFAEAKQFSEIIANSSFAPAAFKGKPNDILIAMQMGREVGLQPLQALQNIAVINGKPSIYGDAMLAICRIHPDFEWIKEWKERDIALCAIKRRGNPEILGTFSIEDAKKAGLWGKQGPWSSYPDRMLQMRARGFALRDAFPDALKGLISYEEASDYPEKDITPKHDKANRDFGVSVPAVMTRSDIPSFHYDPLPESNQPEKATPESVNKLMDLVAATETPFETVNKWLDKAGVSDVDLLSQEQIDKCIKMLSELLIKQEEQK